DLGYIDKVCREIGDLIKVKKTPHTVVVRSTVIPGTITDVVVPILEEMSGKKVGTDFHVCCNPEFLREGTAIHDFYHPPKTIVGVYGDSDPKMLLNLYSSFDFPVKLTDITISELIKCVDNTFHALKVVFANEVASYGNALGVDSRELLSLFKSDTKLNISEAYLNPGLTFGGSCLPKDVRMMSYQSKKAGLKLPVIHHVMDSNQSHLDRIKDTILSKNCKKIVFLGMSFKEGTDDLRESPLVMLVEYCLGKGINVKICDFNLEHSKLIGANKLYVEKKIPHLITLLEKDQKRLLSFGDLFIIGFKDSRFKPILDQIKPGQQILDLADYPDMDGLENVHGLLW
ncbi:MAG: nucleotide sugar dehydrogenase, partial [Candidatus Margulisbacteria bacterium]|nr:nucleotide sugar dehydrogenase [Candidatus Margulisiibacteriota bacterium]